MHCCTARYCLGLGSYKLYVMVGYILDMRWRQSPQEKDYGLLLLRFLRYFGSKANLNKTTLLRVYGASAAFDKTSLVDTCRLAFERAYASLVDQLRGDAAPRSMLGCVLDTVHTQTCSDICDELRLFC